MNDDYSRELHPGYLAVVVGTGLLATFIAQLVPEGFSAVGAVLVVAILLTGAVVYFSRLPERRHAPILSYLRFSLIAFLAGVVLGLLGRLVPLIMLNGVTLPDWIAVPLLLPRTTEFTLHEAICAGLVTAIAVVAFWTSRKIVRPVTFVAAAMAGAILVESALPRSVGDAILSFDPALTYLTWGGLGVAVVLVNSIVPTAVDEMKGLFGPSKTV